MVSEFLARRPAVGRHGGSAFFLCWSTSLFLPCYFLPREIFFLLVRYPFASFRPLLPLRPSDSSNQILVTRLVVSSEIDVYKPAKRVLMKRGGTKYSAYERTSPGDFGPAEQANKANKRGSLAHA
jgi:hypothetical protein